MFAYFHMCLYPSNKIINFFIHENVLDAVKGTVTEVTPLAKEDLKVHLNLAIKSLISISQFYNPL